MGMGGPGGAALQRGTPPGMGGAIWHIPTHGDPSWGGEGVKGAQPYTRGSLLGWRGGDQGGRPYTWGPLLGWRWGYQGAPPDTWGPFPGWGSPGGAPQQRGPLPDPFWGGGSGAAPHLSSRLLPAVLPAAQRGAERRRAALPLTSRRRRAEGEVAVAAAERPR